MADIFFNRDVMWFGTEEKMGWIETPQTGADVSPQGFGATARLQNGGGHARKSWDSHKVFQFSWGDSASRELAAKIHAYRNGTYGRGLIYFHDPMYYDTNILPRRWADPSMAVGFEAAPLIYDNYPTAVATAANTLDLPTQTAVYNLPANYDGLGTADELFIPIPTNFTLNVGAIYSASNAATVLYVRTPGGNTNITKGLVSTTALTTHVISGQPWARIGIRTGVASPQTISLTALTARLVPPGEAARTTGPWYPGEGHSGCDFDGSPTLINYNGVNGGQVGVACTLVEVGAWR